MLTFTCTGCGYRTPDDDTGCLACDTCEGCTPAKGNCADCAPTEAVYGYCTACGSVEVALVKATGTRDFSSIGEHPAYPTVGVLLWVGWWG